MSLLQDLKPWVDTSSEFELPLSGLKAGCDGSRPVMVFIHGNGFSPLTYLPMLEKVYEHFDIYLPEVQGHGNNPASEMFLGWDKWAHIISKHLAKVSSSWPVTIGSGHSFGGVLTTLIAAIDRSIYDRLVLLDPIYLPRWITWSSTIGVKLGLSRFHPMVKLTANRQSRFGERSELIERVRGRGVFKGWTDESLDAYAQHSLVERDGAFELLTPVWLECAVFASYSRHLYRDIVRVKCPTLLVYGASTYPYQRKEIKRLGGKNNNFEIVSVKGAHCFMQEQPIEIAKMILTYQEQ